MKVLSFMYISIISLLISLCPIVMADSSLKSPACLDQFKQPSATIQKLSDLLEYQHFKSFYKNAEKHTFTFGLTTQNNINTELSDKIWHCYLVASAPLFSFLNKKVFQIVIFYK